MKYAVNLIATLLLCAASALSCATASSAAELPAKADVAAPAGKSYIYKKSAGLPREMEIYFPPDHDPALRPAPPADAVGYPSRAADLDALPGFRNPPPGYGQVPFWWWSGELDADRLMEQARELHKKGVSGVQVNYDHGAGKLTNDSEPAIFTEEWWQIYAKVSAECAKLDMGIGMSTYTLDDPGGAKNLFYHLFFSKPELGPLKISPEIQNLKGGETISLECPASVAAVRAYQVEKGTVQRGGVDLAPFVKAGKIEWTVPEGNWQLWMFKTSKGKGCIDPLNPDSGKTVVRDFYQKFEDHNPGKTSKGLNYFFNDELVMELGEWSDDFPEQFQRIKGYDLLEVLPARWVDMGNITPKVWMDYTDVALTLAEERYYKPVHDWHASRGLIFGCDNNGRGKKPDVYGDYFRASRWYTAPGNHAPRDKADLIACKVASSIANLYRQPRVWLEGFHSIGWGASPEMLMFPARESYLYGSNLLNLHGLYYSTYGSHWEWAPPDFHFRMPYWKHMDVFFKYFERLSYLMSQGHTVCDVAVIYPVAPYHAKLEGKATETAFQTGVALLEAGINFEFIDRDSLARAKVENGRLTIASVGASYQALVIPNMGAVYWDTITKAAEFSEAGGHVYCIGTPPQVSNRAGRNDPQLKEMNDRAFKKDYRLNSPDEAEKAISRALVHDVRGLNRTVRALHRKVGFRDVYLVMSAEPGDVVEFRAKGAVEIWDPWTGNVAPLRVVGTTKTTTQVSLPLETEEALVVVFTPGKEHENPTAYPPKPTVLKTLTNEWTVSFEPTMDNTYGDFRLPVTPGNKVIGVEARRFACAVETEDLAGTAMLPKTDDATWPKLLHGHGPKFYMLGPVPEGVDTKTLEAKLAKLQKVDPSVPLAIDGKNLQWRTYDFSWRYGKEDMPGKQGFHGLKRKISDNFLIIDAGPGTSRSEKKQSKHKMKDEEPLGNTDGRFYLWTCAIAPEAISASILSSLKPADVYINGKRHPDLSRPVPLQPGSNPILVCYNGGGRGHFVLRRQDVAQPESPQELAMRWWMDPGLIPFDVHAGARTNQWYRFLSAPGTSAIRLQARGVVQAWIDGKPMKEEGAGRFVAAKAPSKAAVVALRITPEPGFNGASALPEPVVVETSGSGVMPLGDWSRLGILNNYSGGVRYRTTVTLAAEQTTGHVALDLGKVVATAEVHINGKKAGVSVAPPRKVDISGLLKPGENTVEVLVYNTLSNHYQTIPSQYRGEPTSGLMGPVSLLR